MSAPVGSSGGVGGSHMLFPPPSIPAVGSAPAWLRGTPHVGGVTECFAAQAPKITGSCNPAVNLRRVATAMHGFAVLDSHVTAIMLHTIG